MMYSKQTLTYIVFSDDGVEKGNIRRTHDFIDWIYTPCHGKPITHGNIDSLKCMVEDAEKPLKTLPVIRYYII
jgi:hypothetical protein